MSLLSGDSRPLTIKELSPIIGYSIPTIRRWIKHGLIPVFQPAGKGGKLTFCRDAVLQAVNTATGMTATATSATPMLPGPRPNWTKRDRS